VRDEAAVVGRNGIAFAHAHPGRIPIDDPGTQHGMPAVELRQRVIALIDRRSEILGHARVVSTGFENAHTAPLSAERRLGDTILLRALE